MSVYVTMLTTAVPPHLLAEDATRTRRYEDRDGANAVVYKYSLHSSGSIIVWRLVSDVVQVETVIGPAAWEDAQGDTYKAVP